MLISGTKFRAMRGKKNIRTLVLSEKKFRNETKNHNPPPCKLNGRSLTCQNIMQERELTPMDFCFQR
jgi:hypothetical protein